MSSLLSRVVLGYFECGMTDEQHQRVVCEAWPYGDKEFPKRHYHAWKGHCAICGGHVVITTRTHERMRGETVRLLCPRCSELGQNLV